MQYVTVSSRAPITCFTYRWEPIAENYTSCRMLTVISELRIEYLQIKCVGRNTRGKKLYKLADYHSENV